MGWVKIMRVDGLGLVVGVFTGVGDDGGEGSEASGVIMYFVQLCTVSSCNIF